MASHGGEDSTRSVVGFIVTEHFELFFDTLEVTRKVANLRHNSKVAFVIGGTLDFPQLDFLTLGTETALIHRLARPQSAHRIRRRCVVGKSLGLHRSDHPARTE